jgi:hypothetical protein
MVVKYIKNNDGQFVCPHCEFIAKHQSTMHYHLKNHEGALPHPCKHCKARFLQKSLLDLHIRSRHSETLEKKETFKCPCDGCSYEDIRKGNRLIHFLRVHFTKFVESLKDKVNTADGSITCKKCSKSFKSNTQFIYHSNTCIEPEETHVYYNNWLTIRS